MVATENRDVHIQTKLDSLDERSGRLETQLNDIRERVSRLEGAVEQMGERLRDNNSRLNILTAAVITQTIAIVGLIAAILLRG